MLYAHHSECTARHDEHHLPPHEIDESKRKDEEEERNGLLEVDAEDDREGCLDTAIVSCYLDHEQYLPSEPKTHIRSIAPSWSVILCTKACIAFIPCTVSSKDRHKQGISELTAGPTASKHPIRLKRKIVRLISWALYMSPSSASQMQS